MGEVLLTAIAVYPSSAILLWLMAIKVNYALFFWVMKMKDSFFTGKFLQVRYVIT
ncbi:MAG: hypothetical protein V7K40_26145 [Nostoc sp.]|uniref:hypothetical protein n=1 Tax=Nostoc sp. TaxID=1180 RepID=UPI002FFCC1F0